VEVGAIAGASLMMDLEGWRVSRGVDRGLGSSSGERMEVSFLVFSGVRIRS
jgi:hypothetical protein